MENLTVSYNQNIKSAMTKEPKKPLFIYSNHLSDQRSYRDDNVMIQKDKDFLYRSSLTLELYNKSCFTLATGTWHTNLVCRL